MAKLFNLARMTTATTGTGTITLGAAVSGYLTFAQAGVQDGDIVHYAIADGANSETGTAPYTASGTTLGPRTVGRSTNSNAAISLSGTAQVMITALAESLRPRFVIEGDSLSNPGNLGTWPTKLQALSSHFAKMDYWYFATDGDTAANMVSEYATQGALVAPGPGGLGFYSLWAGHNDIVAGTSAATIYGYLTTMWAAARTSGYKVVAWTVMPSNSFTAPQNVVMNALNALILSDATLYDFIIRPDALFTNPADLSVFNDATHLNAAGNVLLAKDVSRTLLSVAPVYATPADAFAGGLQSNGAMEVSQEFGTAARTGLVSGTANYIVDSYSINVSSTIVVSAQQVADAPPGLTNSIKVSVTTALASLGASDFAFFRIPLEISRISRLAFGSSAAQPVSIGFWFKAHRVGTYSGELGNTATTKTSYPFTFTVNASDTWEWKTVTIPGETVNTWNNSATIAAILTVCLAVGSTFAGTPFVWSTAVQYLGATGSTNGVAATTDAFQLTGVVIMPGLYLPSSQRLPLILRPFDQELLYCKRFWQKSYEYATAPATATTTGGVDLVIGAASTSDIKTTVAFAVPMSAAPTITLYDDLGASGKVFKGASGKTGVADRASTVGFRAASSDATSTNELFFQWTANARQ
jgi:hypothetical protein